MHNVVLAMRQMLAYLEMVKSAARSFVGTTHVNALSLMAAVYSRMYQMTQAAGMPMSM